MVFHRHGSLTRDAVYGILANEDFRSLATLCFPSHAGFSSALARSPLPEVLLGSVLVVALDSRGVRSIGLALFERGVFPLAHSRHARYFLGTVRSCGALFLRGFHIKRLARLVRTMRGIPRVLARSGSSRGSHPSAHSPSTRW